MEYKHIVFDLDGTLIDTERAILPSLRDTLETLTGKRVSERELTFALGIAGADALERLGIEDIPAALDLWIEYMRRYQDAVTLFDGVEEMLETLRERSLALGIVTSKTRKEYAHDFARFDIESRFQTAVCAEDTERHKPDPAPILEYMARTGASGEDVLYVGDSVYDSRCAKDAGVDFALALWGTHDPAIQAAYRLRTPMELVALVG